MQPPRREEREEKREEIQFATDENQMHTDEMRRNLFLILSACI
jgi:hypothetical protein